jgi:hypothetical protein
MAVDTTTTAAKGKNKAVAEEKRKTNTETAAKGKNKADTATTAADREIIISSQ